ncbi:MAG: type IX secretion system membrane protein PorP/SprF [Flavobacteriales bacterium]|nr:type IX secretion system membrane protein PorP/SprF [Flavobacteriales bacterium]
MRKLIVIISILVANSGFAQDIQFSQFYAAPMYLNPAFAGATAQSRLILNYRNQWPAIPQAFNSYQVSYDHNIAEINSGVGLSITHDKAGTAGLKYTSIAGQYGYSIKVNRKWVLKPAVQYSLTWRGLDRTQLVFGDQLIRGGASTSVEQFPIGSSRYFDFGAGFLAYSKLAWFGYSWHHVNQPNQSLLGSEEALPFKMSLHGGGRIELEGSGINQPDHVLIGAFNYKMQGKYDQFDLGFYYEHDPIVIGMWYRGIPGIKSYEPGYQNNDAVVFLVGYEIKGGIKIGYSYDLTISRLTSNTAGAHEISIQYQWASPEKDLSRMKRDVPCPKF